MTVLLAAHAAAQRSATGTPITPRRAAHGPDDFALYDRDMRRVVEPGGFTVWAGGSSTATLDAHFTVTGRVVVLSPAPPRFR